MRVLSKFTSDQILRIRLEENCGVLIMKCWIGLNIKFVYVITRKTCVPVVESMQSYGIS